MNRKTETNNEPKYLDADALAHLLKGLSFDAAECARLIDPVLVELNKTGAYSDRMLAWVTTGRQAGKPVPQISDGRIIIQVDQFHQPGKDLATVATAISAKGDKDVAPAVMFNMRSFTLDIPMRLEIPLRAVMKGNPPLLGTYVVYLHVLRATDGAEYLYYGITKRGWALRFQEHTKAGFKIDATRKMPQKMAELIGVTVDRRFGQASDDRVGLTGIVSSLVAVGLTKDQALDTEEYLVDKYSLATKHRWGLNMIPGGRAGLAVARNYSNKRRGRQP